MKTSVTTTNVWVLVYGNKEYPTAFTKQVYSEESALSLYKELDAQGCQIKVYKRTTKITEERLV